VETPRLAILEILLRRWRCLQDAVWSLRRQSCQSTRTRVE